MIKLIELRAPTPLDWKFLAGMGLLVPAVVGTLKGIVLRATILRNLHWGFIPLDGPIDGIWPHAFYRIMHNAAHPFLLIAYGVIFAGPPLRATSMVASKQRQLFVFCGILLFHSTFLAFYSATLFLPVGDLVSTIRG